MIANLLEIFYPKVCLNCENTLTHSENLLCVSCMLELPFTEYTDIADNSLEKVFRGRLPIMAATSLLYFKQKGITQKLIHHLKYKGNEKIGAFFGELLGHLMSQSKRFQNIDGIVIVPLHSKKMKTRGYNQLTVFANVLSKKLGIPVYDNVLVKVRSTDTQTKKSRFGRFEKIDDKFHLENKERIIGKHLLLIDDVVTTGATLEACANELLKAPNVKISIATMSTPD